MFLLLSPQKPVIVQITWQATHALDSDPQTTVALILNMDGLLLELNEWHPCPKVFRRVHSAQTCDTVHCAWRAHGPPEEQLKKEMRPWIEMAHEELSGGLFKENNYRTAVVHSAMPIQAPLLVQDVLQTFVRWRQLAANDVFKGLLEGRRSALHLLGLIVPAQMHYLAANFMVTTMHASWRFTGLPTRKCLRCSAMSGRELIWIAMQHRPGDTKWKVPGVWSRISVATRRSTWPPPLSEDQVLREILCENAVELSATVALD